MTTWQCAGCKKVWQAEEPPAECACGCRIVREAAVMPVEGASPVAAVSAPAIPAAVAGSGGRSPLWTGAFAGTAAALLVAGVAFWLGRSGRPAAVPSAGVAASAPSVRKAGPAKPAASLKAGDAQTVDLGNGVTLELVWCPPGTFWMGSPEGEEDRHDNEMRHRVTLTKGFWIGKYEVAQKQWRAVMGSNPSEFEGDDLPVENVSWEDCQEFCRRLNEKLAARGNAHPPEGTFRLPTEAEWEYACRAGTETAFHYGDGLDSTMANFDGNYPYGGAAKGVYRKRTAAVGSFKPNAWGLFDLHGNVWEWCADWHGGYSEGGVSDPEGAASGSCRVRRGGGLNEPARCCRSAYRSGLEPFFRFSFLGFRLARTLP